jgi:hypothetical protein
MALILNEPPRRVDVDVVGCNRILTICLITAAVAATGCGSSAQPKSASASVACSHRFAQHAELPSSLRLVADRLAASGWQRVSGTQGCTSPLFRVPGDLRLYAAQYANARNEIVTVNFTNSASARDLGRARDAFLAEAVRHGFSGAITDGDGFYMSVPLRAADTQKDVVGWVAPGKAAIVVQRFGKVPVASDARSFLAQLTHE